MSYIVCSNSTFDNENLVGISSAESFQNHFKSPLEIEPNSEVAVESVKINRDDKFDIVASDEFFVYFGEEQSTTLTSGGLTTNAVKIDIPVGSYDRKTFSRAIQDAINKAPLNPAIYNNCSVSVKTDTNNAFDGFTFQWNVRKNGSETDISADLVATQFVAGNNLTERFNRSRVKSGSATRSFTYDAGTKTLTNNAEREAYGGGGGTDYRDATLKYFQSSCFARVETKPLANCCGVMTIDLSANSASDSWLVGLSRPTTTFYNAGYPNFLTKSAASGDGRGKQPSRIFGQGMCDYWVEWTNACATTRGQDKLVIKQWVKEDDPAQWQVTEIPYYDDTNSSFNGSGVIDTEKMNASSLRYLHFQLDGNELKLFIGDTEDITKGNQYFLVDSSQADNGADREYNFKPLGNGEEWLSPVLAMTKKNQTLKIARYDTYDDLSITFPKSRFQPRYANNNYPKRDNAMEGGTDWWSQNEVTRSGQIEIDFNEKRPAFLASDHDDATPNFRYKNVNGSGAVGYNIVLVVNKEFVDSSVSEYDQVLYSTPSRFNLANMGRILGFGTNDVISQSLYGTPATSKAEVSFESFNAGVFAVSSAFIRVNDLTIRSFNGVKQSRSQILYHIPRFTNDGKQFGELYFSAPEKTYIKLNNTDKLMLNNIKIDVVNRNENVVDDLVGSTIVCLHIRPSSK